MESSYPVIARDTSPSALEYKRNLFSASLLLTSDMSAPVGPRPRPRQHPAPRSQCVDTKTRYPHRYSPASVSRDHLKSSSPPQHRLIHVQRSQVLPAGQSAASSDKRLAMLSPEVQKIQQEVRQKGIEHLSRNSTQGSLRVLERASAETEKKAKLESLNSDKESLAVLESAARQLKGKLTHCTPPFEPTLWHIPTRQTASITSSDLHVVDHTKISDDDSQTATSSGGLFTPRRPLMSPKSSVHGSTADIDSEYDMVSLVPEVIEMDSDSDSDSDTDLSNDSFDPANLSPEDIYGLIQSSPSSNNSDSDDDPEALRPAMSTVANYSLHFSSPESTRNNGAGSSKLEISHGSTQHIRRRKFIGFLPPNLNTPVSKYMRAGDIREWLENQLAEAMLESTRSHPVRDRSAAPRMANEAIGRGQDAEMMGEDFGYETDIEDIEEEYEADEELSGNCENDEFVIERICGVYATSSLDEYSARSPDEHDAKSSDCGDWDGMSDVLKDSN